MNLDFNNLSIDDTRRINQISEEIKNDYTRFIDALCIKFEDNPYFWATPLASRNVLLDRTFFRLCRIIYAIEQVSTNTISRVVVENKQERKVLINVLGKNVNVIVHREGYRYIEYTRNLINQSKGLFGYVLMRLKYYECSPVEDICIPEDSTIVIGPAVSSNFCGNNYDDRYTTNLSQYENVIFFPFIINNDKTKYSELFSKIVKCENHTFLYNRKISKISDLLEIMKYRCYVSRIQRKQYFFRDIDITSIVRLGLEEGKWDTTAYEGLIFRKMLGRLRHFASSIKSFVLWYEGRPSDVLISSAIREIFLESKCIGYEGYPLVESLLSLYISEYQYQTGHCPHEIAITSKLYETDAHQFCKSIPLRYVPILRNEYVLKKENKQSDNIYHILVLLSYATDVSESLLQLISAYISQTDKKCEIYVKNHPANVKKVIEDYTDIDLTFIPNYISGKLSDCLQGMDVVVCSITSSALEVVYSYTPIIILYPPGHLGYTALPSQIREKYSRVVYGEKEMFDALDECSNIDIVDCSTLNDLLIPRTEENVRKIFVKEL